jgi:hypothetical protein
MVLTSWAVASVAAWLVFPYFALMAAILFAPAGRPWRKEGRSEEEESGTRQVSGEELVAERAGTEVAGAIVGGATAVAEVVIEPPGASAADLESEAEAETDPRAVKTRRGKGRVRKLKAAAASPGAAASWIQIGPGKFVRVENPGSPAVAESPSSEGRRDDEDQGEAGTVPEPALAPEESAAPAPDPTHVEGNLEGADGPDRAAGPEEVGAVDAALETPGDSLAAAHGGRDEDGDGDGSAPCEPILAVVDVCDAETRDAAVQAFEAIGETTVVEEVSDEAPGRDAPLEDDLSTDAVVVVEVAGDNGIAPDAFADVPPAMTMTMTEIVTEEAPNRDLTEENPEPATVSERPGRPTVGPVLAPWRGLRGRIGLATRSKARIRSGRDAASPGRHVHVRSSRKVRVRPDLKRLSQRGAVRPRQICRTFPPRSPPALAGRWRAVQGHGDGPGPGRSLRQQPGGWPDRIIPVLVECPARQGRLQEPPPARSNFPEDTSAGSSPYIAGAVSAARDGYNVTVTAVRPFTPDGPGPG